MADDKPQDDKIDTARRRLLKRAVYVPPTIIGVVALLDGCAPGSCTPLNCNPNCAPNQSCRPNACRPNA